MGMAQRGETAGPAGKVRGPLIARHRLVMEILSPISLAEDEVGVPEMAIHSQGFPAVLDGPIKLPMTIPDKGPVAMDAQREDIQLLGALEFGIRIRKTAKTGTIQAVPVTSRGIARVKLEA